MSDTRAGLSRFQFVRHFARAFFASASLAALSAWSQSADLIVTMSGPASAAAGADVAYTVGVFNSGPDPATSVNLVDGVPSGMTFTSLASPGGWTCTTPAAGAGGTIVCNIATLAAGTTATFTATFNIPNVTFAGTTFTNIATSSAPEDPNVENDSAVAATTVSGGTVADVRVTKTGPASAFANTDVTFTITVTNGGPDPAASLLLTDVLPDSFPPTANPLTFVSLNTTSGPTLTCTTGIAITCTSGSYPVGSTTLALTAHVPAAASAGWQYTNLATVSTTSTDTVSENDSSATTLTVASGATLTLDKIVVNNNGGTAVATDWTLSAAGPTPISGTKGQGSITAARVLPGTYALAESGPGGYSSPGYACVVNATPLPAGNSVTLLDGETATCTITNDDNAHVSYSGNGNTGGTAPVDNNTYPNGATVAVAGAGTLVRSGFSFVGWNTAANGSGTAYAAGTTFAIGAANVTLFAQWTVLPTFTVTYNGNGSTGGTVPVDANNYLAAATVTVLGNTGNLVRTGLVFGGWNTAANGGGTTYAPGATFAMGAANVTLFAKWVAVTTVSGPSPVGAGTISASLASTDAGCGFTSSQFIPVTGNPASPPAGTAPAGVSFPFGLFAFTVGGCTLPGASVTVTVTYPGSLPAGSVYWKYGPTPTNATPSWYLLPATISGNTAVFKIVDGALGDDDRTANGTIVDQGGPGVPPLATASAAPIPTISEWAMTLLASLLLLAGMRRLRRRG